MCVLPADDALPDPDRRWIRRRLTEHAQHARSGAASGDDLTVEHTTLLDFLGVTVPAEPDAADQADLERGWRLARSRFGGRRYGDHVDTGNDLLVRAQRYVPDADGRRRCVATLVDDARARLEPRLPQVAVDRDEPRRPAQGGARAARVPRPRRGRSAPRRRARLVAAVPYGATGSARWTCSAGSCSSSNSTSESASSSSTDQQTLPSTVPPARTEVVGTGSGITPQKSTAVA